jgi:quinol monooxygenase YgiN
LHQVAALLGMRYGNELSPITETHEMSVAEQVSWRVILSVRPDQLTNFKLLTREMVEATRQENGVLSYERFVTDDGRSVHVHERYKDSQAAVHHLREFKRRDWCKPP